MCCFDHIGVISACTACDNSLLYHQVISNYFIKKCEMRFSSGYLFSIHFYHMKDILHICL